MCWTTNLAVLISPQSTMRIRHKKLQLKIKLGASKSILVWSYFWLDENVVQNSSILKWKLLSSRTKLNPMADFELHDFVLIASMSKSFALLATFCSVDIVITVISKWLWLENHSKTSCTTKSYLRAPCGSGDTWATEMTGQDPPVVLWMLFR